MEKKEMDSVRKYLDDSFPEYSKKKLPLEHKFRHIKERIMELQKKREKLYLTSNRGMQTDKRFQIQTNYNSVQFNKKKNAEKIEILGKPG